MILIGKTIMNVKKINLCDQATDLWNFYNPEMPFFVGMIGFSDCRKYNDKNYYVERKNSQLLAIEYIKEGEGFLEINDTTYHLKANSLVILKKHSSHKYYPSSDNLWVKEWIVLDGELAHKMIDWYIGDVPCIENYNADYFFTALKDLHVKYKNDYESFIRYATLLFSSFMIDIDVFLKHNTFSIADKIKSMIDYSSSNLSVKDIADKLHYSVNYVIRTFKSRFGFTPAKYHIQRKIDLAMLYLRTGDDSISDISDNLNFIDQHYFSNVFKNYTGLTPSQYRAKFRK